MKRRNTMGSVRALDAKRARVASQGAATGRVAGHGQDVDASGRIIPKDGSEFYRGSDGALHPRLGDFLRLAPGSPRRIVLDYAALRAALASDPALFSTTTVQNIVQEFGADSEDLDGGEPATWLAAEPVGTPRGSEPWEEFDQGEP